MQKTAYEMRISDWSSDVCSSDLLELNMAGFYYDYSNMQVKTVLVGVTLIENAASSRIYGFDGDFTIHVTDGFSLSGGVGLQNGRFTDYKNEHFITAEGIRSEERRLGKEGVSRSRSRGSLSN